MPVYKVLAFDTTYAVDEIYTATIEKKLNDYSKKGWRVISQSALSIDSNTNISQLIYLLEKDESSKH